MFKRMLQLSNGNHQEPPAARSKTEPGLRTPAVVEPEANAINPPGLGALKSERAPALLTDFEQIYQSGAVKPPRLTYGVLKVIEMLNSPHLSGMATEAKRSALLMALEAGNAKVEEILQDAIVRQRLLNDYEEARLRDLEKFEAAALEQNRTLQAELDRISAQYTSRMQNNLDEVARGQDNFRVWQKRKQQESQRIADAAAYCVPETNVATASAGGLAAVLERASSASAR